MGSSRSPRTSSSVTRWFVPLSTTRPRGDRRRAHAALAEALDAASRRRPSRVAPRRRGRRPGRARRAARWRRRPNERGSEAARPPRPSYLWRAAELTPDRVRAAERLLEAARAELIAGHGPQAREILDRARADGLGTEHEADAAWTEALIHIVAGNVREPAALLASALPRIEAGDTELAVGACVAADADGARRWAPHRRAHTAHDRRGHAGSHRSLRHRGPTRAAGHRYRSAFDR